MLVALVPQLKATSRLTFFLPLLGSDAPFWIASESGPSSGGRSLAEMSRPPPSAYDPSERAKLAKAEGPSLMRWPSDETMM